METTQPETQGATAAKSFDLDAMGLGPPAKVRRRGRVSKLTKVLRAAVVLLVVFNIGVKMGHGSRPKEPAGAGGVAGTQAKPGAPGSGADGAGTAGPDAGAPKPATSGTITVVDGTLIYVAQPDGTTRKVVAGGSTRFTRTVPAGLRDLQPGDRVTVEGTEAPDGSVDAALVDAKASTLAQP